MESIDREIARVSCAARDRIAAWRAEWEKSIERLSRMSEGSASVFRDGCDGETFLYFCHILQSVELLRRILTDAASGADRVLSRVARGESGYDRRRLSRFAAEIGAVRDFCEKRLPALLSQIGEAGDLVGEGKSFSRAAVLSRLVGIGEECRPFFVGTTEGSIG